MKPSYCNAIAEWFAKEAKNNFREIDYFSSDTNEQFNSEANTRISAQKTFVAFLGSLYGYLSGKLSSGYEILDANGESKQCEFDYLDTMPAVLNPKIMIFTTDLSELTELEEFIMPVFEQKHKLMVEHPILKDAKIPFEVLVHKNVATKRDKRTFNNTQYYVTTITLVINECVLFSEQFSAAQLSLDPKSKNNAIKFMSALESFKALLTIGDANGNKDKIAKIDEKWKGLDKLINATQGITDYRRLFSVMSKNNCSADKALEQIKKEIAEAEKRAEQEAERIRNIDELYCGEGDKSLNVYIDAVVKDIADKLESSMHIPVFGGSTYLKAFNLMEKGQSPFPMILISGHLQFDLAPIKKNYTNIDASGNEVQHGFTEKALPINYAMEMLVRARDESMVNSIMEQLKKLYGTETSILASDSAFPGESRTIKVMLDNDKTEAVKQYKDYGFYQVWLYFKTFPSVYYTYSNFLGGKTDQIRHLILLQQAEYMIQCEQKLHTSISCFENWYKPLFDGSIYKSKSLIASGLDKLGSAFKGADYRTLKERIKYHQPYDKSLFDSVFKEIVTFFPDLYDKSVKGVSCDTIYAELRKYHDYFNTEWNSIIKKFFLSGCFDFPQLIGVSTDKKNEPDYIILKGLHFFINHMFGKPAVTINSLIPEYKNVLEIERRQREEAEREYEEMRQARREERNDFLGNMVSTAMGVKLGNRLSGNRSSKDTKKDLMGSARCVYGKKGLGCFNCPVGQYCTRR